MGCAIGVPEAAKRAARARSAAFWRPRSTLARPTAFSKQFLCSTLAICERTGEHAQHFSELKALRNGLLCGLLSAPCPMAQALLRAPLTLGRGQEQTLLGRRETFYGLAAPTDPKKVYGAPTEPSTDAVCQAAKWLKSSSTHSGEYRARGRAGSEPPALRKRFG
jgi:hypothetical protein